MKRLGIIAIIIYLLALYALISSYIYFSQRQVEYKLSVVASESIDPNQKNLVAIWANSRQNDLDFGQYSISIDDLTPPQSAAQKTPNIPLKLAANGQAILALPAFPKSKETKQNLDFRLIDPQGKTLSRGTLDFTLAQNITSCPVYPPKELRLSTPNAFISHQETTVFLSKAASRKQNPQELIEISATYGMPTFKSPVAITPPYPSRSQLALSGPADLSFKDRDTTFYDSLITNERPLASTLLNTNYTPQTPLELSIATLGGSGPVTVDIYSGNAWIDRQTIADSGQKPIVLKPELQFPETPQVFLLRLCLSSWACGEQADKRAFIASKTPLSLKDEALIALQAAQAACPNDSYLDELSESFHSDLKVKPERLNDDILNNVKDYALYVFADANLADISLRLKTEEQDMLVMAANQEKHKGFANVLLVALFGLGVLAFSILVLKTRSHRTRGMYAVDDGTEVSFEREQKLERFISILAIVVLALSILGMLSLMYFMMQLL